MPGQREMICTGNISGLGTPSAAAFRRRVGAAHCDGHPAREAGVCKSGVEQWFETTKVDFHATAKLPPHDDQHLSSFST